MLIVPNFGNGQSNPVAKAVPWGERHFQDGQ
jgi:hypothetical protein